LSEEKKSDEDVEGIIDIDSGELKIVKNSELDDPEPTEKEKTEQVRIDFAGESIEAILSEGDNGNGISYDVVAITAGVGNGWNFTAEALRRSVALWEGVETFIDHGIAWGGRSVRDLAGVCTE